MMQTLGGIPQFLRHLGAFAPPNQMLEALVTGPLHQFGTTAAMLFHLRGNDLVAIGAYNLTPEEITRFSTIAITTDVAIARAVRQRQMSVLPEGVSPLPEALSDEVWDAFVERVGIQDSVNVPLVHADRVVGGLGLVLDRQWDPAGLGPHVIHTVAASIGLWMTHPRSRADRITLVPSPDGSLALTDRQQEILRRVGAGESTYEIATALAVSESSVKGDLAGAMRTLRAASRHEAAERALELGFLVPVVDESDE